MFICSHLFVVLIACVARTSLCAHTKVLSLSNTRYKTTAENTFVLLVEHIVAHTYLYIHITPHILHITGSHIQGIFLSIVFVLVLLCF